MASLGILDRMLKAVSSAVLAAALLAVCATPAASSAVPDDAAAGPGQAGISIVHGKPARIADWPWQVAIAYQPRKGKKSKPRDRTFCGGAVIAPTLVVTAGHCVARFSPKQAARLEVISGRTWLNNQGSGEVTPVQEVLMPTNAAGKRRYREQFGSANWDVALLRLGSPVSATPIKLAGRDEYGIWSPGRWVHVTGWGVTNSNSSKASPRLRMARQVMLKGKVCRAANGAAFKVKTMNCHGGPGGNSSSCFGDSGGPSVAAVGEEYRLVGLTSFGDDFCRGSYPSVDARVSGDSVRNWVARTAMAISGLDVVGAGGTMPEPSTWCRVPHVAGLTVGQARAKLKRNRCRLGTVSHDKYSGGRRGRILGSSRFPGWLAPVGFRLRVWLPG